MRTFVALGEIRPLVSLATDELFHEMGIMPEITVFLEQAADSEALTPEDRLWALDGLVFGQMRDDREQQFPAHRDFLLDAPS